MQQTKNSSKNRKEETIEIKEPAKNALKKPREFNKGSKQKSQIFAKTNKLVQLPADPNLFKGLVFYLDITHDGNSKHTSFKTSIEELGGKIAKRLDKNVTHLIW